MNNIDISLFERNINYSFNCKNNLILALTHSSYSNEHKNLGVKDNERLEFLGDAILDMVISEYIYKKFPEMPEGELTKLRASVVCEHSLAEIAKNLNFGDYMFLGKGEEITGGRNRVSILADAFEAVIGAIFIDGGFEAVKNYIINLIKEPINNMKTSFKLIDCKTHLQEIVQKNNKNPIIYKIVDEKGPDHNKIFVVNVYNNENIIGVGAGKSKKEAEQNAAFDALKNFE